MDIKDVHTRLMDAKEYTAWRAEHADDYLVHFFVMMPAYSETLIADEMHVGFYDKSKDLVTSFQVFNDKIVLVPPEEAFKKDAHIEPLAFDAVSVSAADAYATALAFQKEKYPQDKPTRVIVLLQQIGAIPGYNMTFITATFQVLNIKVSAIDGEVFSEKKDSLMSFKAPESD